MNLKQINETLEKKVNVQYYWSAVVLSLSLCFIGGTMLENAYTYHASSDIYFFGLWILIIGVFAFGSIVGITEMCLPAKKEEQ